MDNNITYTRQGKAPVCKIIYKKTRGHDHYTATVQVEDNLRFAGEVWRSEDGLWNGWAIDPNTEPEFSIVRRDFASKRAATKWTNDRLREELRHLQMQKWLESEQGLLT